MLKLDTETQWALVDKVFDDGYECYACPHCHVTPAREDEPGGRDCHLMFSVIGPGKPDPTLCPGYGREVDRLEHHLHADLLEELECQEV